MAATFFVQPLDLVKNRMQLSGEERLKDVSDRNHYNINGSHDNTSCKLQEKAGRSELIEPASMPYQQLSEMRDSLHCTTGKILLTRNIFLVKYLFLFSLSAGLLRQATYSTTRLGVYQSLFDHLCGYVLHVALLKSNVYMATLLMYCVYAVLMVNHPVS